MTISSATRKAGPYSGNDTATSFAFTFKIFTTADVAVTLTDVNGVESTLALSSDYSVTMNGDQDASPGGSITYPLSGSPLATGEKLTITGDLSELQLTEITNGGGFFPKIIEYALDRVVIFAQQLRELSSRSLRLPVSSTASAELPSPEGSNMLGWNAAGTAIINYVLQAGTSLVDLAASSGASLIGFIQAGTGAVLRTLQDKARERVSVKDFGAVGDGVTNDTAKIQAAIDAVYAAGGGSVFFPAGNYKISTSVNLKTGVSLHGAGAGIAGQSAATLTGGGGSAPILQYVGTFGAEARLKLEIDGLTFTGAQYAIYLKGAANVHIHNNSFNYIRGSVSHAAVLLEGGILTEITENLFFYCATGIRGDGGLQYQNTVERNDFVIDDTAGLSAYKTFGILLRSNTTDVGFGPFNIRDNNFIKAAGGGTPSSIHGVYAAARGQLLNVTGNTFEAISNHNIIIDSVDPITAADHAGDATGMYVAGGEISGNFFIDGANGSASDRFVQVNYGSGLEIASNYFMPQAGATGRSMVQFSVNAYGNTFELTNKFNYRSGYTGAGVDESNSSYGKNVIWSSQFIDSTTDGPNILTLKNGSVLKLEPSGEYAPTLAQYATTDEGARWYSNVSHRPMLVTQDGSAVVHARIAIETAPRYVAGLGATLTINPADSTIRVASNTANLETISTAYYDGQVLRIINIGAALTIAETGNIQVNGGATLVLATNEGATFVWSANDSKWIQVG